MKKITKWKRILTVVCIVAMIAGIVSPSVIYAGNSENTVESAQSEVSSNSGNGSEENSTSQNSGSDILNPSAGDIEDTSSTQEGSHENPAAATEDTSDVSISPSTSAVPSQDQNFRIASSQLPVANTESDGIDLADGTKQYLTSVQVSWLNGNDWQSISDGTSVPNGSRLRFTANFGGISAEELITKGSKLYLTLPFLLQNPSVSSNIVMDANQEEIGTITAEGNRIILQFRDGYLQEKKEAEGTSYTIKNGSLVFTASPDPEQVRKNYNQTLAFGPVNVTISFDPDSEAKSGSLILTKSTPVYLESSGAAYLKYSLTVTAGDVLMPDVTVVDHFTANANAVDSYMDISSEAKTLTAQENVYEPYETITAAEGTTPSSGSVKLSVDKSAADPGTMLWTIGDMAAGETRTLYYMVKLKDDYVGTASAESGAVTNTATPKSKTYEHNSASSTFTPKTSAVMSKTAGDIRENKDNTITIPYTITITADKSNTWTLKNLKISDYFGTEYTDISLSTLKAALTRDDTFPNLGFGNFELQNGNKTEKISVGTSGSTAPYYVIKGANEKPGFNLYLGDIKPGDSRKITFEVTMKPVFSASDQRIGNRASAFSNDASTVFGNKPLAGASVTATLKKQNWDRKIQGEAIRDSITQPAPASAYVYRNGSWSQTSTVTDKVVPKGSYQYRVVVNEKGKWDVSSSSFTDTLSQNGTYLKYAGYLKLDYFADGISSDVSGKTDAEVADILAAKTPYKTVYLDIEGMYTFTLSPDSLDSALGTGAYLLTYYAAPVSGNFSRVVTGNSFSLSGNIRGSGGNTFILPAMNVKTNVTVTGTANYSAHKDGWYYDSKDITTDFTRGKLYWVITVNGSQIPKGVQFRDVPGTPANATKTSSIAGIYFGKTPADGSSLTENYAYYSQIEKNADFAKLDSSNYSWQPDQNGPGVLTFNKDIVIPDGSTMYIILMTSPGANVKLTQRDHPIFSNTLWERSNRNISYNKVNEANLMALGEGTNFKEVGEFGNYVAGDPGSKSIWSDVKQISDGNDPSIKIINPYNTGDGLVSLSSGTYIDYRLVVNYAGDEEGTFRVEDLVPNGMEPVYVRYFFLNRDLIYTTPELAPTMPEITNLPGGDWADIGLKNTLTDGRYKTQKTAFAYYDKNQNKIIYDVSNLHKGAFGTVDTRDLQVQIVMRVTDKNALIGQPKNFTNTMNVYRTDGSLVSTSSTNTTIQIASIEKTAGKVANASVPFTLKVNPRGEDLLPGSDNLTLVDELSGKVDELSGKLSGSLIIDPASVEVKDSSGTPLDSGEWKLSLKRGTDSSGKQPLTTMTLVLPDSKSLTITYNASIDAAPDISVPYSNTAYWFGYKGSSSPTIDSSAIYSIGANLSFEHKPVINLIKADQNDVSKELPGAEFSIYLARYNTDTGKWEQTGEPLFTMETEKSGTHAGILSFVSDTQTTLLFNTVYCIVETKAPAGYVKDSTPIFIAMARKDSSGNYPTKFNEGGLSPDADTKTYTSNELKTWAEQGVIVNYYGSTYTYTAYNQKASLKIVKSFLDKSGNSLTTPPDGTFSFGLYNSNQVKLETLTITYTNGKPSYRLTEGSVSKAISEPVFTDLNVGDTYAVYELDADGDPVQNGRLLYNKEGNGYVVTYPTNADGNATYTVLANDSLTPAEFAISNKESPIPETGIHTGHTVIYGGIIAVLAGIVTGFFFLKKKKRIRRKQR